VIAGARDRRGGGPSRRAGPIHLRPAARGRARASALSRALAEVSALSPQERVERRYAKFRNMGRLGQDFADRGADGA